LRIFGRAFDLLLSDAAVGFPYAKANYIPIILGFQF